MTRDEIQAKADQILRELLAPQYYDTVEVREDRDHADVEALDIEAKLKPGTPLISGEIFIRAMTLLSDALLASGEKRFPYLRFNHPDDERPVDEDRKVS